MPNIFAYQGSFLTSLILTGKEIKVNEMLLARWQHFLLGYLEKKLAAFLPDIQNEIHVARKWVT